MTILRAIIIEARYILQIRKEDGGYNMYLLLHTGAYADLTQPPRNEDTQELVIDNYSSLEGAEAEYELMQAKLKNPSLIAECLKKKK